MCWRGDTSRHLEETPQSQTRLTERRENTSFSFGSTESTSVNNVVYMSKHQIPEYICDSILFINKFETTLDISQNIKKLFLLQPKTQWIYFLVKHPVVLYVTRHQHLPTDHQDCVRAYTHLETAGSWNGRTSCQLNQSPLWDSSRLHLKPFDLRGLRSGDRMTLTTWRAR